MEVRRVVDLSHELHDGMPTFGGKPVSFGALYTFEWLREMTAGKASMQGRLIVMPEHCGTHMDVPAHFVETGATTAQVSLDMCVLPGHLLDLTVKRAGEAITVSDLERAEERSGQPIGGGKATIVWTGVDKDWGTQGFQRNRPFVPVATARWLVERGITLFATDLVGMDDPEEWWWPTHRTWLEAGVSMVQQLCHLDELVGEDFVFVALPLKMRLGTASPVRAVALLV